jgi:hypothetical protein
LDNVGWTGVTVAANEAETKAATTNKAENKFFTFIS